MMHYFNAPINEKAAKALKIPYIVLAAGLLLALIGLWAIWTGSDMIMVERGWTRVIAGTMAFCAGAIIATLGLLLDQLRDIASVTTVLAAAKAVTTAEKNSLSAPHNGSYASRLSQPDWGSDASTAFDANAYAPATPETPPAPRPRVAPQPAPMASYRQPTVRMREREVGEPSATAGAEDWGASDARSDRAGSERSSEARPAPPAAPTRLATVSSTAATSVARRPPAPTLKPSEATAATPTPHYATLSERLAQSSTSPPAREWDTPQLRYGSEPAHAPSPQYDEKRHGLEHHDDQRDHSYHDRQPYHDRHTVDEEEDRQASDVPHDDASMRDGKEVIGRYDANGAHYVMYSDGSIDAETSHGVYHFASMDELKNFIEGKS